MITRRQAAEFLKNHPIEYGHMLGFTKLRDIHNRWIIDMLRSHDDKTLQASRGTYKTTCVSIALALIIILLPNKRTLFLRKTDNDVKEIVAQVQKILKDEHTQYFVKALYGVSLQLITQSATEISTNLTSDIKGTKQLVAFGIGSSITGKHFDYIFTDDIVNITDRISKAEREKTKLVYQELHNIKNRDGRIYNTGTPWHQDDCFAIMPKAEQYNCYHQEIQHIISSAELEELKSNMLPSLFAANYELRFIASENVIFDNAKTGADKALVEQGIMHLDSAFGGEDYTAWCIAKRHDNMYYVLGRARRAHVETCYADICSDYDKFHIKKLYTEDNADKGFVAKELRQFGVRAVTYHESQNKYLKIVTYLKKAWANIVFVDGTDDEFIQMILDYNEDAEHDDPPDSLSSMIRILYKKPQSDYTPLWN